MSDKYIEYKGLNMPSIEQEVLQRWKANDIFKKSVESRNASNPFVFYEGPPSANGMPGIHHVISRTLKDLICRYKTMQGYQVRRKAGWDTHGLPVELGVEKELGITKEDIGKKISVEDYNKKCREAVMRYKKEWEDITEKMGYWVDMNDPYITFDNKYIETLWWALKQLHEKGYLYKSVSIQPYSPAAGTGLSNAELNMPGTYKDVKDTTIVAMFHAIRNKESEFLFEATNGAPVHFLAWTTTPWTLPSNCGLTVGANIDYVLVSTYNQYTHQPVNVVLAKALLHKYFKQEGENGDFAGYNAETKLIPWKIIKEFKGKDIEGCRYEQLLPYEGNTAEIAGGDPWRVITGDFVTTEDGTGIVHTAPAFGADDYRVGKKNNIGILTMVDKEGKFTDYMGELSGRYVKNYKDNPDWQDTDVIIAVDILKKNGKAFKVEKYEHTYPHCWRTDKPVIYYPLDAWFIKTTAVKDRMIELNKTINWKPKTTGEGRFGKWLENMVDWNLSRSRYWGTPLPVWATDDGSEIRVIGSVEELKDEISRANKLLNINQDAEALAADLHKPYVDQIVLVSDSGKAMTREPDLIDVWFDSGAMPYAQLHYPFENHADKTLHHNFPADFIAEGVDQTRGWFYTLHALGVMLFDSVAYKTVVSNGLVLDKNGNKMSKRLGNTINPFDTIEQYSADATRWYLITNASPWDSLRFDLEGIREVQRKYFGTLYNTYQFFALYANVDGFTFKEKYIPHDQRPEIDRWILSSLESLAKEVEGYMDDYEPTQAGRVMETFLDEHLSNWYVRLCRRRFWKGEYEHDKICAYQTLYECLETLSIMMAPIAPFFADWLYTNLNGVTHRLEAQSVHLADFPDVDESIIDTELEERMQLAQDISSLVLSLRKKVNIKVRQPLQKVLIPVLDAHMKGQVQLIEELVKGEVNVKSIEYLTETEGFIKKKIKANFKSLGARMGAKMKAVAAAINQMDQHQIAELEKQKAYQLTIDGEQVTIGTDDVEIIAEDIPGWSVANKGNLTVALDITVTPELQDEGNARELVNRIQKIRKETGLELTDRINVNIEEHEPLKSAILNFRDYICTEILADRLEIVPAISDGTEIEVNESVLKVLIYKN
ncbi:MAG: isoleucine--tRNA ligase [Bacteroidetes bacterium 43-93]|nr:isoleucine--tRNA ligase [Bacteroidota bacterium]OJW98898.1 MAG: isoleucine--tRNA ligase [Bacteroidetes bacterium 43-93]